MNSFLHLTAEDLIRRHGTDLSHVTVVFPGKRAGLFLSQELSSISDAPLWAPHYVSIDQLFGRLSGKTVADPVESITTLYDIYQSLLPEERREEETIDRFWGWGEVLLADFDDIDKHMVDAGKLFINAKELNELIDEDTLSKEQREALQHFFADFGEEHLTRIKAAFRMLWERMPVLYRRLREEMPENVAPYTGAMMREVAESDYALHRISKEEHYAFVGFNMLSEVEEKLMKTLEKRGQATFYWDYDTMYLNPRFEAGDFIRHNLEHFPNAIDRCHYDNMSHHPGFTFISTPSDSTQTQHIPDWLNRHLDRTEENRSAIVLCDEQLLESVLHSIPDNEDGPQSVNITMGYGMAGTPAYSLVVALLDLQTDGFDPEKGRFRHAALKTVTSHPYARYIDEALWKHRVTEDDHTALLKYIDEIITCETLSEALTGQTLEALHRETLFQVHTVMQKFATLLSNEHKPLRIKGMTLRRLIRRALESISIPFHGEPATGLQVMGLLETRCIDFRNVLVLSAGEGFLPKGGNQTSIIPYTLRTGFGMTTQRHRMATFAYYFYRLIQRAEHVTCIYNDTTAFNRRNEISRFLRQLQAETTLPIKSMRMEGRQDTRTAAAPVIEKNSEVMRRLHDSYLNTDGNGHQRPLSPSSLNRYLSCPLQFFYNNVAGIQQEEDLEDGIDARLMGNIFHRAAQTIYTDIIRRNGGDRLITHERLALFMADKHRGMDHHIDAAFKEEAEVTEFLGENIIVRAVVQRYIRNLLRYDQSHTPFTIIDMERPYTMTLEIPYGEGTTTIRTGGYIDRIDLTDDGTVRIVDYKTGVRQNTSVSMDKMFSKGEHAGYYLQTLLYAMAYIDASGGENHKVKPVLLYPAKATDSSYDPTLTIDGQAIEDVKEGTLAEDFIERLKTLAGEIFDRAIPFEASVKAKCAQCPYAAICQA